MRENEVAKIIVDVAYPSRMGRRENGRRLSSRFDR